MELSPKGTVPVLLTDSGQVLEESLDIINWALDSNDPEISSSMDHMIES